jgi:uncharacterized protein with GYD domain
VPMYVSLVRWTDQGIRTAKEAASRLDQQQSAIDQAGGRVVGLWWTQGAYDAVAVLEWPDDETASVAAIGMGMAGNVRTETMRAFTTEEMRRILERLP